MYYRVYNKPLAYNYKLEDLGEIFHEEKHMKILIKILNDGFYEDEIFKIVKINEPQT